MGTIHDRMMDAEQAANKDIQAKDYQHTAAYSKLLGADERVFMSGAAINRQLSERVRKHIQDQSKLNDYNQSHLGAYNFRTAQFDNGNEQMRSDMLAHQTTENTEDKRNYVKERHERTSQDVTMLGEMVKSKARSVPTVKPEEKSDAPSQRTVSSRSASKGSSIRQQKHHFSDTARKRYNPYA